MRCLRKNTSVFWYAFYKGKTPVVNSDGQYTGEYTIEYSDPIQYRGNVSAGSGSVNSRLYGVYTSYDRTIVLDDPDIDIDESAVVWIERTPQEGSHDYIVKYVSRYLNSVTIGLKKVSTSE